MNEPELRRVQFTIGKLEKRKKKIPLSCACIAQCELPDPRRPKQLRNRNIEMTESVTNQEKSQRDSVQKLLTKPNEAIPGVVSLDEVGKEVALTRHRG